MYAVCQGGARRFGLEVAGEGVPRRPEISRLSWSRAYFCERVRMLRSAEVFAIARKPLLAKVWGE